MSKNIVIESGLSFVWIHFACLCYDNWLTPIIVDNIWDKKTIRLGEMQDIIDKPPIFFEGELNDQKLWKKITKSFPIIDCLIITNDKLFNWNSRNETLHYYTYQTNKILWSIKECINAWCSRIINLSSALLYNQKNLIPPFTEKDAIQSYNPYTTINYIVELVL